MRKRIILLIVVLSVALLAGIIGYGYAQTPQPTVPAEHGNLRCCASASAYASTDERLNVIRQFRDGYLMPNPVGRGIAAIYYNMFSPPVADFINGHPSVKPVARVVLWPIVAISTVAVDTTLTEKLAMLGFLALGLGLLVALLKRHRRRRSGHY